MSLFKPNKPVYITPQMYGAVGDGVADDTAAVQAALDKGGHIFFPAGRYKVTSKLRAEKPCKIEMYKQYPNAWVSGDAGNYPLTSDENWMGARIETYSTNGGMLLGSSVDVDGLFLRAMSGFAGVLLTYDDSVGPANYPATSRLAHIRLDVQETGTIPVSMFDFLPNGCYNYILDDITIGRMRMSFCEYAFRADISKTTDKWANSVYVRNLCIDTRADYPLYIIGSDHTSLWKFDGLNIQTYPYDNVTNGRTGHLTMVTLKNIKNVLFSSCHVWDVTDYKAYISKVFEVENVSNISCIGCGSDFEEIDTAFSEKMGLSKNFNISKLDVSISTNGETGENTLSLSDGVHEKEVVIPAAVLSDDQVGNGIEKWMDENAVPTVTVGLNKLNMNDPENGTGYHDDSTGKYITASTTFLSHFIPVKNGDAIRMYQDSTTQLGWWRTYLFDADKNWIGYGAPTSKKLILDNANVAYIKQCITMSGLGVSTVDAFKALKITVTINSSDKTYEPYTETVEGGLGSYLVLSSPNGTKYTLEVSDNGTLTAKTV